MPRKVGKCENEFLFLTNIKLWHIFTHQFFKGFLIIIHLKKKNQCISVKLKESARENKKTEKDSIDYRYKVTSIGQFSRSAH